MRAVNDGFDTAGARHFTDRFDRRDLSCDIDLVGDLNQTRARRDRSLKRAGDFANVLWWDRNLDQVPLNAFTLFALADSCPHPATILPRRPDFIAGLEIKT